MWGGVAIVVDNSLRPTEGWSKGGVRLKGVGWGCGEEWWNVAMSLSHTHTHNNVSNISVINKHTSR